MSASRAFWIESPGRGAIRDEALTPPGPSDVVVRALVSGISRGTEALVFQGRVPVSEHGRMRAPFQDGEFPAPVKYGYAAVGVVETGPPALLGQRVFCLHPHQTRFVVPAVAVTVLPTSVPTDRAVLAPNMETALNGLWDLAPRLGDRIAVVGAGAVGCLTAFLATRIAGCEVELIDVNPRRETVARALGVRFALPAAATRDADLVVHASGQPSGLVLALDLAGFESRIVDLSWYGETTVTLPLGGPFHARRLAIVSSQVGHISPAQRPRWTHPRRMQKALSLLGDPALDVLLTGESPFASLPDTMASLVREPGDTICHLVRY